MSEQAKRYREAQVQRQRQRRHLRTLRSMLRSSSYSDRPGLEAQIQDLESELHRHRNAARVRGSHEARRAS